MDRVIGLVIVVLTVFGCPLVPSARGAIPPLLQELERICEPTGKFTDERLNRIVEIKRILSGQIASGNADVVASVRDEFERKVSTGTNQIGYVSTLLELLASWSGFVGFAKEQMKSPNLPEVVALQLIGVVAGKRSTLTEEKVRSFFTEAARSENDVVRLQAIQYLIGFSPRLPGPQSRPVAGLVPPLDSNLGMELLRASALRGDVPFERRERFLTVLLARERNPNVCDLYAAEAKKRLTDERVPLVAKLRYAEQLLSLGKIDATTVEQLRRECRDMKENGRTDAPKYVRVRMQSGAVVREEFSDPTTAPAETVLGAVPTTPTRPVRKETDR